jgi:hypothetical protein
MVEVTSDWRSSGLVRGKDDDDNAQGSDVVIDRILAGLRISSAVDKVGSR